MTTRDERPGDEAAITAVVEAAFRGHPHSDGREPAIVLTLRRAGALSVSLVAEYDGRVVGHVAFSPVTLSGGPPGWYGLGPVAVLPEHQRRGIGRSLIDAGLAILRGRGAAGCVVVGDPKLYTRFGFAHFPGCVYEGLLPDYFLCLPFGLAEPSGVVTYHEAFGA